MLASLGQPLCLFRKFCYISTLSAFTVSRKMLAPVNEFPLILRYPNRSHLWSRIFFFIIHKSRLRTESIAIRLFFCHHFDTFSHDLFLCIFIASQNIRSCCRFCIGGICQNFSHCMVLGAFLDTSLTFCSSLAMSYVLLLFGKRHR